MNRYRQQIFHLNGFTVLLSCCDLELLGLGAGKWLNNLGAIGTFGSRRGPHRLGSCDLAAVGTSVTMARFSAFPRILVCSELLA